MYIQTITYLHYALARSGPNLDLFFVWQSDAPPPFEKITDSFNFMHNRKGIE